MPSEVVTNTRLTLPQQLQPRPEAPATAGGRVSAPASGSAATGRGQVEASRVIAALTGPSAPDPAAEGGAGAADPARDTAVAAPPRREEVEQALNTVEEYMKSVDRQLDFRIDEVTGRMLVQVVDPESGELIRQVPPEEVVAAAHAIAELAQDNIGGRHVRGLFISEEV